MRVVCVLGSPRKNGNSATVARRFVDKARSNGSDVQVYLLNELEFKGCQACMACKTTREDCVLDDGLTSVLKDVSRTDVLVLASPIYFGGVSAQMKAFIDRTYSFLTPHFYRKEKHSRLDPGKKLVFILSQGQKEESKFQDIFVRYEHFLKWYGFDDTYVIRACGVDNVDDVLSRQDILDMTDMIAEKIWKKSSIL
ncbi:MAG: flavodoxin family protein [Proteobacteria bacterium]|nr:flavodoxin family protein [Pseudomonadota bacterium]